MAKTHTVFTKCSTRCSPGSHTRLRPCSPRILMRTVHVFSPSDLTDLSRVTGGYLATRLELKLFFLHNQSPNFSFFPLGHLSVRSIGALVWIHSFVFWGGLRCHDRQVLPSSARYQAGEMVAFGEATWVAGSAASGQLARVRLAEPAQ